MRFEIVVAPAPHLAGLARPSEDTERSPPLRPTPPRPATRGARRLRRGRERHRARPRAPRRLRPSRFPRRPWPTCRDARAARPSSASTTTPGRCASSACGATRLAERLPRRGRSRSWRCTIASCRSTTSCGARRDAVARRVARSASRRDRPRAAAASKQRSNRRVTPSRDDVPVDPGPVAGRRRERSRRPLSPSARVRDAPGRRDGRRAERRARRPPRPALPRPSARRDRAAAASTWASAHPFSSRSGSSSSRGSRFEPGSAGAAARARRGRRRLTGVRLGRTATSRCRWPPSRHARLGCGPHLDARGRAVGHTFPGPRRRRRPRGGARVRARARPRDPPARSLAVEQPAPLRVPPRAPRARHALREACQKDSRTNPTPEPYRAFASRATSSRAQRSSPRCRRPRACATRRGGARSSQGSISARRSSAAIASSSARRRDVRVSIGRPARCSGASPRSARASSSRRAASRALHPDGLLARPRLRQRRDHAPLVARAAHRRAAGGRGRPRARAAAPPHRDRGRAPPRRHRPHERRAALAATRGGAGADTLPRMKRAASSSTSRAATARSRRSTS